MCVGENIKRLRKQKGWTQKDLAENSMINLSSIKQYEAGRSNPKYDNRIKLANTFGVHPDDLTREPRPDPNVCDVRMTGIIGKEPWYDIEFHTPYYDEYLKVSEFCKKLVDERKHRDE